LEILVGSCAESCLPTVHPAGSVRGLWKIGLQSRPKLWTAPSLLNGTCFGLISWCHHWTTYLTSFRRTTGGYLHSCACVVYTRLVKLFYANLEVVQDDDHGVVLQSSIAGHLITVDPQVISHIIRVLVLEISASPYNEVVLPPSLYDLREFFCAVPQGEERSTAIRIGALSSSHRRLAKIVQQNIWPVARRSDLILKWAQFVYAIHLRLPFCLCKHILGVILEARDESTAGLPFGCL
jgi:hypothetical protein